MDIALLNNKIVYEDEKVIVLMKSSADANGELLLTTKKDYENLFDIDRELLSHIYDMLSDMKRLICDRLNPNGIQIVNNYGMLNMYNTFYLDIIPIYSPKQPLVDVDIIYDKLK